MTFRQECIEMLQQRGVQLIDIAECVVFLQKAYFPNLTVESVIPHVEAILEKREVQHAIMTGISFDVAVEKGQIENATISKIVREDESLYGVDEVLAYGICNLYGSIALTNYGYIDRTKPGIIAHLNDHGEQCHTFLDDIVGAIAASAASRIAHSK